MSVDGQRQVYIVMSKIHDRTWPLFATESFLEAANYCAKNNSLNHIGIVYMESIALVERVLPGGGDVEA